MIGFYKDISNYLYTKKCFKLVCEDVSLIKTYKPRVTPFGILYMFWCVPSKIDQNYHNDIINQNMQFMDASLSAMGLSGVIDYECRYVDINEDEEFVYLIKFKPIFNFISLFYIVKWTLIITIIVLLFINKEYLIDLIKML